MKQNIILIFALIAGLVLLEHFVIERSPEKINEDNASNLAKLPASHLLPSYISYLFLGSFRAIAVDVLWLQLKNAAAQKRIYLVKELSEFISVLQPRNEEVWAMLSWNTAHNISFVAPPHEKYKWEKYGFLQAYNGIKNIPNSPYLKFHLAFWLWKHAQPSDGELNLEFIGNFLNDLEIQKILQELQNPEAKTPFEIAIKWMSMAAEDFRKEMYTTQMGLVLTPFRVELYVRDFHYIQTIYYRHLKEYDKVLEWIDKAIGYSKKLLLKYPDERGIIEPSINFYRDALDAFTAEKEGKDELHLAEIYEKIIKKFIGWDQGFIWWSIRELKKRLTQDNNEPNDHEALTLPNLKFGATYSGAIGPTQTDIDIMTLYPLTQAEHENRSTYKPKQIKLQVKVEGQSDVRFVIYTENTILHDSSLKNETRDFAFTANVPVLYYVRLEVINPKELTKEYIPYQIMIDRMD